MRRREQEGEWKLIGIVSLIVAAPCLLPALYHLAHGNWGLALLFAIPSLCCCLFYLGTLWMFGVGSVFEMGMVALIISVLCVILTPVVLTLYGRHLGGR